MGAVSKIKGLICDKSTRSVCCPVLQSCVPANGSCLPELGNCGKAGREQRIVGGKDALPGEFPFTALLGRKGKRRAGGVSVDVRVFTCGGTLINLRYVVTAAHCHHATIRRKQISLVRLGEYEVTDHNRPDCAGDFCLEDPQDFDLEPEDVILHPDYGQERQDYMINTINDIALIRLPRTASPNLAVRVVCLPIDPKVAAEQLNIPNIDEGLASFYPTIVGWGHTQGLQRVPSPVQQKLAVPVQSSEQ